MDSIINSVYFERKKFNLQLLQLPQISDNTKLFLTVMGFPEIEIYDALRFSPYIDSYKMNKYNELDVLELGELFESVICLEPASQHVLMVKNDSSANLEFVNSDIFSFVQFIDIYSFLIISNLIQDENSIITSKPAAFLENKFNSIDQMALKAGGFWSRILSEVKYYYNKDI